MSSKQLDAHLLSDAYNNVNNVVIHDVNNTETLLSAKLRRATREGQWVLRAPLHIRTLLFFSARHGSRNPGFVLRPLSPYAIASSGAAYTRRREEKREQTGARHGKRCSSPRSPQGF